MGSNTAKQMSEALYRYQEYITWHIDDPDPDVEIILHEFQIIKETKCGCWVRNFFDYGSKRWVSDKSKKRFAHRTKKEALDSFLCRKKRHISILENKLKGLKIAYALAREKGNDESAGLGKTL